MIQFQAYCARGREYRISDPGRYHKAMRLTSSFHVRGKRVWGESLTYAVSTLRLARCMVPGKAVDQETMFRALGYMVAEGINDRGQSCTVVYKE